MENWTPETEEAQVLSIDYVPKKKNGERLEYKDFKNSFFKIKLSGFKGESKITQIQEKATSIIFQLIEKDIKIAEYEKEMAKYEKYTKFDHPNVLKLHYYSSVFREESHGKPFCRISLLIENAETDLRKQIDDFKANSSVLTTENILALIRNCLTAFSYLQENSVIHGNMTLKNFFITKDNEFKILPNYFAKANVEDYSRAKKKDPNNMYYFSPEAYKQVNSRAPFERVIINPYKSDVFTLGMNLLEVATLENCSKCYKLYDVNEALINEMLEKVKTRYSDIIAELISKMLVFNSDARPDFITLNKTLSEAKSFDIPLSIIQKIDEEHFLLLNNPDYLPQDYVNEIETKVQHHIKKTSSKAVEIYPSKGSLYVGEVNTLGKPHGYGSMWWATGDRYEGKWDDGNYEGEGMYFFRNGMKHYGKFKNGEVSGLGVRYYADKGIYFGEWRNGKNHGTGVFIWPNGEKFFGTFKDDDIDGLGVLTWLSGRKIEAIWDDKGQGIGLAETPEYNFTLPTLSSIAKM